MEQWQPLRVFIVGPQEQFGRILATNIQCWGHKVVILPDLRALCEMAAEILMDDVLLYDLDESFRIASGGQDISLTAFLQCPEAQLLRNRLSIVFSNRSVPRAMLEQIGAVALLQKPFQIGRLQRYLRVLQHLVRAQNQGEVNSQLSREKLRVLIVDDDKCMARTVAQCLASESGYDVALAYDGLDALEKSIDWSPHCVVTDLIMPWMNGYQVIRCLAHRSLRSLPAFVIMSALTQREVPLGHLYNTKAVTYVDKPFLIEHLLAAIKQVCA
jgi:CheY-like chemotaxis protein